MRNIGLLKRVYNKKIKKQTLYKKKKTQASRAGLPPVLGTRIGFHARIDLLQNNSYVNEVNISTVIFPRNYYRDNLTRKLFWKTVFIAAD